tara:strand:- start:428 stop:661 length:234 start_codon:yes stop_codon:yes gene_type:complete
MEEFMKRRSGDARFAPHAPRPEVAIRRQERMVPWYAAPETARTLRETHTASAAASGIKRERHAAAVKTNKKKSKKED